MIQLFDVLFASEFKVINIQRQFFYVGVWNGQKTAVEIAVVVGHRHFFFVPITEVLDEKRPNIVILLGKFSKGLRKIPLIVEREMFEGITNLARKNQRHVDHAVSIDWQAIFIQGYVREALG